VRGLPVGVSLWGPHGSEATLLRLGHAIETARDADLGPLSAPTFPDQI
jgi:amidase